MTRTIARNERPKGRDWVVGDIHGCFHTLRRALHGVSFEKGRDRLFSVGDLIDRGPHSIEALAWLEGGCFEAVVMGNHEAEMVRMMQSGEILAPKAPYQQWMRDIRSEDLPRWHQALVALPLAVSVETPTGQVGIVHCSAWRSSWTATVRAIEQKDLGAINTVLLGTEENEDRARPTDERVIGVDRVIAGHSPGRQVKRRGNTWTIDTGAGLPAMNRLTLARIDLEPVEFQTFDVREPRSCAQRSR